SGDRCRTPDNRPGECIGIKQCSPLIALLTQTTPVPKAVLEFLQKSQCGFEGRNPLVCCPIQNEVTTPSSTAIRQPENDVPIDASNHPNVRLLPLNICGQYNSDNKVWNGEKTKLFEYPWMVLLAYNRDGWNRQSYRCGGTIINEKYVLTAAHCVKDLPSVLSLAGVRIGEYDLQTDPDCMENENGDSECANSPIDYRIETTVPHPSYSPSNLQNDIALVRIRGKINFRTDSIKPICLPIGSDQTRNLLGQKLIVSGWGTTEKGTSSNVLLKVSVPVVSREKCESVYNRSSSLHPIKISSHQICAGGENDQDSCDGDSGGPLIFKGEVNSRPRFVQYGIVSFGPRSCGIKGFPAVYTRVSYYTNWILSTIRP
ncbi:hypothetical protein L9F63_012691, partial [Diploptera punctata]